MTTPADGVWQEQIYRLYLALRSSGWSGADVVEIVDGWLGMLGLSIDAEEATTPMSAMTVRDPEWPNWWWYDVPGRAVRLPEGGAHIDG